ncbi:hypothetical protein ACFZBC_23175 [Streptomyces luteogriseus]|jgi:hypothetical protein|uniref:hypothetical protein n=1 Tax=Streptomyces luteogriseus TaxID=68233 RepID=UPI0036EFFC2F
MTGNPQVPYPSPDDTGSKGLHLQIGRHLNVSVRVQMSPAALSLLLTALAAIGGSAWGVMQR